MSIHFNIIYVEEKLTMLCTQFEKTLGIIPMNRNLKLFLMSVNTFITCHHTPSDKSSEDSLAALESSFECQLLVRNHQMLFIQV